MRRPAVANVAWLAAGAPAAARFHRALASPEETQQLWLRRQLERHARSAYGQELGFAAVRDYEDFARRVPLVTYEALSPYVDRIRGGEQNVLVADRVTHLVPTSGSSGARKLIPFTKSLSESFDAAVAPWIHDLARRRPGFLLGPSYWSVSPWDPAADNELSTVPIGFDDDATYLGGAKAWLVRQSLAVPPSIRSVRDEQEFWRLSLIALLRARDLRLISVWHPSFLELLVGTAASCWTELLDTIGSDNPERMRELRAIGPDDWPRWWPSLQIVSCWGEQHAQAGWRRLASRLPHVLVQRKGLLATECVVTLPLGDAFPLAITSHFFEFMGERGDMLRAHELERGRQYEVVVTNGAGLWRYRLGDVVECDGHVRSAPSLRFLGRAGRVSDLRGEKLSEAFVADALRALWDGADAPQESWLRGWQNETSAGYELVVAGSTAAHDDIAHKLERSLEMNPHYALSRRLGQLAPLRVVHISREDAHNALRARAERQGSRIGDVKPLALELTDIET